MNSLFSGILLISSVITLGLGTDLTVNLNNPNSQRTGEHSTLGKSQEKPLNNIRLNEPINSLSPRLSVDSLLEIQLSATEWDWQIRKYGTFACQVVAGKIRSPYDIMVDFENFDNLAEINSNPGDSTAEIGTRYAITQLAPPPENSGLWIPAQKLNNSDYKISAPVEGVDWNLWCMIKVTNGTQAGEYENQPTITFILQGVTDWIETEINFEQPMHSRFQLNELQSGGR